ncbi:hypothetical protein K3G63_09885 [Hymenobacter sp. HSC-4F20]|uniref:hypothetical protein n=1 Tax=Hymenobacter sp. HSC-4F20 TaxID=2864135 RepID=UPI001C732389|nr:hypothetical protein [Hymenobacter sp. HSC-4F20]MBX0290748.1 hypothetical protein [Hymenobacter sp. HSC-4F20]
MWIVASQVNTPVVQQLWHSAKKRPTEVTLLQPSAVLHFASLLATLHDHHGQSGSAPTYPQLSVYGLPPTPGVVEDLAEFGFRITQELPDNWIAVRLEDVLQP